MESFEVRGEWWLPNDTRRVPGVLRFNPSDGAILELMGGLGNPIKEAMLGERNPAIAGVDVHGKLYTVFSPRLQSFKIGGMFTSSYMSSLLLKGAHYASEDDARIRKVTSRFWSLEEWVNLSGIEVEIRHSPPEVMIQYCEPPKLTIDIDSCLRLSIEFALSGIGLFAPQKSVSIEQEVRLSLEAVGQPFGIAEAQELVRHLRNFITLGIGEPTSISECNIVLDGITDEQGRPVKGALFWPQGLALERRKSVSTLDMLFTWNDLGDNAGVYIRNWFVHRKRLQRVFDLYFGVLHNPWLYDENVFLAFVQALELYHRIMGSNQYELPPEQHEKRLDTILSFAPEEHREWLREKLKYSNQATLRQRIKELWDDHRQVFEKYFGKRREFIRKLIDTRNYLVHQDESLKDRALSGLDLRRMNRSLFLLLGLLCLLDLLGMSQEQVEMLLERRRRLLEGLWRADGS